MARADECVLYVFVSRLCGRIQQLLATLCANVGCGPTAAESARDQRNLPKAAVETAAAAEPLSDSERDENPEQISSFVSARERKRALRGNIPPNRRPFEHCDTLEPFSTGRFAEKQVSI